MWVCVYLHCWKLPKLQQNIRNLAVSNLLCATYTNRKKHGEKRLGRHTHTEFACTLLDFSVKNSQYRNSSNAIMYKWLTKPYTNSLAHRQSFAFHLKLHQKNMCNVIGFKFNSINIKCNISFNSYYCCPYSVSAVPLKSSQGAKTRDCLFERNFSKSIHENYSRSSSFFLKMTRRSDHRLRCTFFHLSIQYKWQTQARTLWPVMPFTKTNDKNINRIRNAQSTSDNAFCEDPTAYKASCEVLWRRTWAATTKKIKWKWKRQQ